MPKISWGRVIIGGIIAAIICFLTDGLLHERLVGADWKAVYDHLGAAGPKHDAMGILYFAVFDLGRAMLAVVLYAFMRPHCKPGPKTAVCAAVIGWLVVSITTPAQFIPLGFFSNALLIKVGAAQLVTSILATLIAAALYKDPAGSTLPANA